MNQDPLEEQSVLLITELSLQPPDLAFWIFLIHPLLPPHCPRGGHCPSMSGFSRTISFPQSCSTYNPAYRKWACQIGNSGHSTVFLKFFNTRTPQKTIHNLLGLLLKHCHPLVHTKICNLFWKLRIHWEHKTLLTAPSSSYKNFNQNLKVNLCRRLITMFFTCITTPAGTSSAARSYFLEVMPRPQSFLLSERPFSFEMFQLSFITL